MKRTVAIAMVLTFALCVGCATTNSTTREIDRQIGYLESLEKAHASLTDKLAEIGEQIQKGKADLETLKQQREAEIIQKAVDGTIAK